MLTLSCNQVTGTERYIKGQSSFNVSVKPSPQYDGGVDIKELTVAIRAKLDIQETSRVKVIPARYLEVIEDDAWASWTNEQFNPDSSRVGSNYEHQIFVDASTNKLIRLMEVELWKKRLEQAAKDGHSLPEVVLATSVRVQLPDSNTHQDKLAEIPENIKNGPGIHISIKSLTGKTIYMQTHPTHTVKKLKELIQDSEGIPPNQQRLIFDGKQLDEIYSLWEYEINDTAVLHLVLRLRGGMYHESSGRDGIYGFVKDDPVRCFKVMVVSSSAELISSAYSPQRKQVEFRLTDTVKDVVQRALFLEGDEKARDLVSATAAEANESTGGAGGASVFSSVDAAGVGAEDTSTTRTDASNCGTFATSTTTGVRVGAHAASSASATIATNTKASTDDAWEVVDRRRGGGGRRTDGTTGAAAGSSVGRRASGGGASTTACVDSSSAAEIIVAIKKDDEVAWSEKQTKAMLSAEWNMLRSTTESTTTDNDARLEIRNDVQQRVLAKFGLAVTPANLGKLRRAAVEYPEFGLGVQL